MHDASHAGSFDYVIIGAGAAGCILANRLSADPSVTVCLLEAGPTDRNKYITIPAGFTRIVGDPRYLWNFQTEPTERTGGRAINLLQGKTLGGGTSVNGMVYNRGQPRDFDLWAEAGNRGWSYADVLPFFKGLEDRPEGDPAYRGSNGPLTVSDVRWDAGICKAFTRGCVAAGVPENPDYNGPRQLGVAPTQALIGRGKRVSSATAFLRPVDRRPNLEIRTGALATKILLDGKSAKGVAYRTDGGSFVVEARREIVLSAGSISSAKLLQLSGIGNPEWLGQAGIEVAHSLPGVGGNFRDHFMVCLIARGKGFQSINQYASGPRLWLQVARWLLGRQSVLALSPALIHYFLESGVAPRECDIQGIFTPASSGFEKDGRLDTKSVGMTCAVWQHRPRSTGFVRVRSGDADEAPLVQPNYLAEELDRQVLVSACRKTRALLESPALAPFFDAEMIPGAAVQSDDEWLDFAARTGSTVYHPVGTARMGPATDPGSVVDDQLRVHGIQKLRVADSSIMPTLPSANTAAAAMMIGAKAAQLMTQRN